MVILGSVKISGSYLDVLKNVNDVDLCSINSESKSDCTSGQNAFFDRYCFGNENCFNQFIFLRLKVDDRSLKYGPDATTIVCFSEYIKYRFDLTSWVIPNSQRQRIPNSCAQSKVNKSVWFRFSSTQQTEFNNCWFFGILR